MFSYQPQAPSVGFASKVAFFLPTPNVSIQAPESSRAFWARKGVARAFSARNEAIHGPGHSVSRSGAIYFDITDLLDHFRRESRVGGIQRVSLATIARFRELGEAAGVRLIAFHPRLKQTLVCDVSDFPLDATSGPQFSTHFGVHYKGRHSLDAYLDRRYRSGNARLFNKYRLIASNALTKGKTFRRKGVQDSEVKSPIKPIQWRTPDFSPGDVVLISGGLRVIGRFMAELSKARREKGVALVQFVHDVLPLTAPQFYLQGHPLLFADWLDGINDRCDRVITTTTRNANDFNAELIRRNREPIPVRVVPLAHEFRERTGDAERPLYEQVSTRVLSAARVPYVLCVGTREIRKNNLTLAKVWQQLESKYGASLPRLVFAGRQGWMNEEFDRFLLRTDNVNDSILIVESPSDDELAHLYKNCLFSLFPSFCEGWGLPIGESLWFDRPVIASNLSSMPDVAGDLVDYVDPYDSASIEAAVERLLDPVYRQERTDQIRAAPKRRWSDFADDLLKELRQIEAATSAGAIGRPAVASAQLLAPCAPPDLGNSDEQ
jgi:glycosyltransferase involved in cell wall biosynthesis